MIIVQPFQVALDGINQRKTIDYTEVTLALVKILKWVTHARSLTMAIHIKNLDVLWNFTPNSNVIQKNCLDLINNMKTTFIFF